MEGRGFVVSLPARRASLPETGGTAEGLPAPRPGVPRGLRGEDMKAANRGARIAVRANPPRPVPSVPVPFHEISLSPGSRPGRLPGQPRVTDCPEIRSLIENNREPVRKSHGPEALEMIGLSGSSFLLLGFFDAPFRETP